MTSFPERIDIWNDFCAHCHAAIDRVPYKPGDDGVWIWRWVHHNDQDPECNCRGETARPGVKAAAEVPA